MRYFPSGISTTALPSTHVPAVHAENGLYARLMVLPGEGDPFDRHVLASALVRAAADAPRPLTEAMGLNGPMLAEMLDTCFQGARDVLGAQQIVEGGEGELAIEEEGFRNLLLAHRTAGHQIEEWLARIIVRRSMCPDHLWCNLGVRSRKELSQTLFTHFRALAEQNVRDMRWKKFFYREMCQMEGIFICKSPVCDTCPDFSECFSTDD